MADPSDLRVLAIGGSLRAGSNNRALLIAAAAIAPAGVTIELEPELGLIPPFNEDDEGDRTPAAVTAFRERIGRADALLIATPEYNHSVPGALKNAVDWASRPYGLSSLVAKPIGLISSSSSPFGAVWAQAELRKILTATGARVLPDGVAVSKVSERFGADGVLTDAAVKEDVTRLISQLVELVREPADHDDLAA